MTGRVLLDREPCAFGVPREQCHIGCGRSCRRAADRADVQAARRKALAPVGRACCGDCGRAPGHAPCGSL